MIVKTTLNEDDWRLRPGPLFEELEIIEEPAAAVVTYRSETTGRRFRVRFRKRAHPIGFFELKERPLAARTNAWAPSKEDFNKMFRGVCL